METLKKSCCITYYYYYNIGFRKFSPRRGRKSATPRKIIPIPAEIVRAKERRQAKQAEEEQEVEMEEDPKMDEAP